MKTETPLAHGCFAMSCLLVLSFLASPAQAQTSTEWVEMPDGVRLVTDIWMPDGAGPWPVVLIRTPYDRPLHHLNPPLFVDNGYAFVVQSCRGRFGSEGQFWMFHDAEVDGHATIEWIAQQPWCDGNIGMVGQSGMAVTQYAVMHDAPPALKCLAPERVTTDAWADLYFQGGAFRDDLANYACSVYGEAFCVEALLHRLRDSWWDPLNGLVDPELVHVPILHVNGWYDTTQQGSLDVFAFLQHTGGSGASGNQYLIIDPLDHSFTFGLLPLPPNPRPWGDGWWYPQHILAWMDHWLKGEPSGVDEWPSAQVYLMGACEEPDSPGCHWVDLDDWPPPHRVEELYLAADGGLSPVVPQVGELELPIDPNDPVRTWGGANSGIIQLGPTDQTTGPWPPEFHDHMLTFTTEVLAQPVHVMGQITVRVWIRPDTPDLDLSVRLTDVYPDGRSILIVDGIQRARMRCNDFEECFLPIGEPTEIEVDLWSTAMVFNAGHRIRVAIAGTNWNRFERNSNDGGDLNDPNYIVANPDILFGPDHPTSIELPIPFVLPFWEGFEAGDTSAWSAAVP